MRKYQTLLLDADGTLFDFDACESEALKLVFQKYGYPLDDSIKERYETINKGLWLRYELGEIDRDTVIYTRFSELFRQLGIEDDGILFEDDYQKYLGMQHFFIEGAPELLEYLFGKYDLYIVTNGVTATQYRRLRESGVEHYMKRIFVSEETGYQKPQREFFDYCFQRIDPLDLSRTLIIGDSLSSDILGGNNAGIDTCWYNPGALVNDMKVQVNYEIRTLKELSDLL